jgi:protein-S-isoprenylcysteine O-methyltransferase Ste14
MSRNLWLEFTELLGRAALTIYFGLSAMAKAMSIDNLIVSSPRPENWAWSLVSEIVSLAFLCLVAILALTRLKPLCRAEGIQPRLTAMIGTYLVVLLITVNQSPPFAGAEIIGTCFVAAGLGLSVYVLAWLGRSFSIMAEARGLVTGGPYGIVRHPLYVTEAIATLGFVLLHWSPIVVLAFGLQWCLQLQRMRNEEAVLRAAFPEYGAYAERVPCWLPGWNRFVAQLT